MEDSSQAPTFLEGLRVGVMQGADRWIGVLDDLLVTPAQAIAVVRFKDERAPVLSLGKHRAIEFLEDDSLRTAFEVPGRVVLVHREDDETVVFHFEIHHELTALIEPKGAHREHCRVKPAAGTVQGWVRAPGHFVECDIVDLSPAGLGCVYTGDGEGSLVGVWRTEVQLLLPTMEHTMRLTADIRRRLLRTDSVVFGLQFDWRETQDTEAKQRKLMSYLHRRQLEIMRNLRSAA